MIQGACNCGAVAFEVDAAPNDLFICHCSICRRFTGSSGIAVALASNADFRWLRGTGNISHWKRPGADWDCWFCTTCGSPLPGANDADRMFIPAGLIDGDGSGLKVAHHIWVGSKAAWDEIGDAGHQHHDAFQA